MIIRTHGQRDTGLSDHIRMCVDANKLVFLKIPPSTEVKKKKLPHDFGVPLDSD